MSANAKSTTNHSVLLKQQAPVLTTKVLDFKEIGFLIGNKTKAMKCTTKGQTHFQFTTVASIA